MNTFKGGTMRIYFAIGFVIVAICASSQQAASQSASLITLRGSEYAFSIALPERWNLDTARLALQHLARAVLYPAKSGAPFPQIEVLPATKSAEGSNTLRNLLSYSAHFDSTTGARHIENTSLVTKDGKKVLLVTSAYKGWQTVNAYIEEAKVVVVFQLAVLDLKTEKDGMEVLNAVVMSYASLPLENGPKR
jgi:hypothetical protein